MIMENIIFLITLCGLLTKMISIETVFTVTKNGSKYFLSLRLHNFDSARQWCMSMNTDLVLFQTNEHYQQVLKEIETIYKDGTIISDTETEGFLGVYILINTEELYENGTFSYQFSWASESLDHKLWAKGEPQNYCANRPEFFWETCCVYIRITGSRQTGLASTPDLCNSFKAQALCAESGSETTTPYNTTADLSTTGVTSTGKVGGWATAHINATSTNEGGTNGSTGGGGSSSTAPMVAACGEGYEMDSNGVCTDVNECVGSASPCAHICTNTDGGYLCFCHEGYTHTSMDETQCEDVDECTDGSHQCIGTSCYNTKGSYHCGGCPANHYEMTNVNQSWCIPDNCVCAWNSQLETASVNASTQQEQIDKIYAELIIEKTSLSSHYRKLNSAQDGRVSSKAIGASSIMFICGILGLIVVIDAHSLLTAMFFSSKTNPTDGTA